MGEDDISRDLPPDGDRRTFKTEYGEQPPSVAVVEAIAAIEGVPSPDLDFALYDHINPDALDALFGNHETDEETPDGTVAEFRVDEYAVTVAADGALTIRATEEPE